MSFQCNIGKKEKKGNIHPFPVLETKQSRPLWNGLLTPLAILGSWRWRKEEGMVVK
jgi:hypothetical protein